MGCSRKWVVVGVQIYYRDKIALKHCKNKKCAAGKIFRTIIAWKQKVVQKCENNGQPKSPGGGRDFEFDFEIPLLQKVNNMGWSIFQKCVNFGTWMRLREIFGTLVGIRKLWFTKHW